MTRQYPFSSKLRKMKAMLKLLWPLLIVKLVENSGFNLTRNSIFCSAAYFNLPCDTRQDSKNSRFHAGRRWPIFGAKLEAWTHKMFHIFRFLKPYMVLAIINPFSWIFNAISREKICLIPIIIFFNVTPVSLYSCQDSTVFPPAESWLVNSSIKFQARQPYAKYTECKGLKVGARDEFNESGATWTSVFCLAMLPQKSLALLTIWSV